MRGGRISNGSPIYASDLRGAANNSESFRHFNPFAWLPPVWCRLEVGQEPTEKKKGHMTKKAMIAGAAIAGLMSGSFAVTAHAVQTSSKAGVSLKMGDKDKDAQTSTPAKGEFLQRQRRLQDGRQRLQRQELLQGQRRLRDRRQQASRTHQLSSE